MLDPAADLEQIFANDFSVAATWKGTESIRGILDVGYSTPNIGGDVSMISTDPTFTCRSSEVTGAAEGDTLSVSGVDYVIREVMPDGTGVTEFTLERQ